MGMLTSLDSPLLGKATRDAKDMLENSLCRILLINAQCGVNSQLCERSHDE